MVKFQVSGKVMWKFSNFLGLLSNVIYLQPNIASFQKQHDLLGHFCVFHLRILKNENPYIL